MVLKCISISRRKTLISEGKNQKVVLVSYNQIYGILDDVLRNVDAPGNYTIMC
jgi:hypothetical protein